MKKQLLSIGLICFTFLANSQNLITENFDSYSVGTFTTQNGWTNSGSGGSNPGFITVINNGISNNSLNFTGAANETDYRSVKKTIPMNLQAQGNSVLVSTFLLNTGAKVITGLDTSKNYLEYTIIDNSLWSNVLCGIQYSKLTNKIQGLTQDYTDLGPGLQFFLSKKVELGVNNTSLVLENDKTYQLSVYYDMVNLKIHWTVKDVNGLLLAPVVSVDYLVQNSTPLVPAKVKINTDSDAGNVLSSSFWIDDLSIDAKSCTFDENANFTYSTIASHCLKATNLTPEKSDVLSSGIFSSTSGITLNSASGVIDMNASNAGTYLVKYIVAKNSTLNSCADTSVFTVSLLNCAGLDELHENTFKVFPNPANDILNVGFSNFNNKNGTITLISSEGRVIEEQQFLNSENVMFDINSLKKGVYFLKVGELIQKVLIN